MILRLKKYIKNVKLSSQNGETLVETLCAVLICVLAVTLLAGGLTAAARINNANAAADTRFRNDLSAAEGYTGAVSESEIVVTFQDGSPARRVDVELYGDDDSDFVTYRKKVTPP